jgi:hypothetical protein
MKSTMGGGKAKYFFDHDEVIRYVSMEDWKSIGLNQPLLESDSKLDVGILIHTSIPFGIANFERFKKIDEKAKIESEILSSFYSIFPHTNNVSITQSHLFQWESSQISKKIQTDPSSPPFIKFDHQQITITHESTSLNKPVRTPQVYITGDMFTESNFEGCRKAAKATVEHILYFNSSS